MEFSKLLDIGRFPILAAALGAGSCCSSCSASLMDFALLGWILILGGGTTWGGLSESEIKTSWSPNSYYIGRVDNPTTATTKSRAIIVYCDQPLITAMDLADPCCYFQVMVKVREVMQKHCYAVLFQNKAERK